MEEHQSLALGLILIVVLGIGAQWLAWALRVPAIVLLTLAGLAAGPVGGVIDPSTDFGDLLRPIVALSVALILFEGGLNLRLHEFREAAVGVRRLVSIGVVLTWLLGAAAAHFVGGLSWPISLLFAAILVVTGPTVIMPLLRQAKLARRPASYLKWEGIINDPIGALLTVLVFEFLVLSQAGLGSPDGADERDAVALVEVLTRLALSVVAAACLGIGVGLLLRRAFGRGWVPEFLKAPVVFGAALGVFGLNNLVLSESGLLATTILGIVIGNTRNLGGIESVRRFKEYLTLILVSMLFILMTADLDPEMLTRLDWRAAALLAVMLFVVRPAAVLLATIGAGMTRQERALVAWIAPRGIVAASVAGFFGPSLAQRGHEGAEMLVPLVFAMIFLTVTLHGFSLKRLARRLGLAAASAEGVLIVGASAWSIGLARTLSDVGVPVVLSDTRWHHLRESRLPGIRVHRGEILSGASEEELDLYDVGYVLATTSNDAYNALVCTHFAVELGHERVFQLPMHEAEGEDGEALNPEVRGQTAISHEAYHEELAGRYRRGWRFETTHITDRYSFGDYLRERPDQLDVVLAVRASGTLAFNTAHAPIRPEPGDILVTFVPRAEAARAAE